MRNLVSPIAVDQTEVYIAEEAFFVGIATELAPITSFDHRPIGDGTIGEITKKLRDLYSKDIKCLLPDYHHWLTKV